MKAGVTHAAITEENHQTYKCHKAHASADVPHLYGLVSGSRQQKRPRFTTLLSLQKIMYSLWHIRGKEGKKADLKCCYYLEKLDSMIINSI